MSISVLIINGATRVGVNTDLLVNKIIEGCIDTGVRIKLINLREKHIADCIGCYQCLEKLRCSLQDDMADAREEIHKAKLLVFASPLYWDGVTGLMKNFIDRLFFYYHPQNRGLISGKKVIIITPMNQRNTAIAREVLVKFYNRLFDCLGVRVIEMFFFDHNYGKRGSFGKAGISQKGILYRE